MEEKSFRPSNLVDTWGLYPWFEEDGPRKIHPDDYEEFKKLSPYGRVFLCIDEEGGYITLKYDDKSFRVTPDLYRPVATELFPFRASVKVKSHPDQVGIITDIKWHHKQNEPMYYITFNGKNRSDSRRYWTSELEQV